FQFDFARVVERCGAGDQLQTGKHDRHQDGWEFHYLLRFLSLSTVKRLLFNFIIVLAVTTPGASERRQRSAERSIRTISTPPANRPSPTKDVSSLGDISPLRFRTRRGTADCCHLAAEPAAD